MTPEDVRRKRDKESVQVGAGTWAVMGFPEFCDAVIAALDARDALLREVLAYLGTCYAEGDAPDVLEPKIRAMLGEKP
jgi:hypothetical protein